MKLLSGIVALFFAVGLLAPLPAQAGVQYFEDFPARVYSGYVQAPDLTSHPDAHTYRTRLRNAAKGQVNFAGEYILATWGCGTSCLMGAAINARTGRVIFLPFTVCCSSDLNSSPIDYRVDSNLIVFTGLLDENDPDGNHYYELRRGSFDFVDERLIATNNNPAPPVSSGNRTDYSATRVSSSGAYGDVTEFTLINDLSFDITVNWIDGQGNDVYSEGGDQTASQPWVSPNGSWRVERGAKTWESHWFSVVANRQLICSFSPRQNEIVYLSELPPCKSANNPSTISPTCPKGYSFSGGQCQRDNVAPTPNCPSGFKFSGGQCVRNSAANPSGSGNRLQCLAQCDQLGTQCDRELTQLGDAQGWDGDLRQDYWLDTCVPRINICKFNCNPSGPIGPGECRYTADGGEICS